MLWDSKIYLGHLTKRKIIRGEPSKWPLVAHNGPFPQLYFLLLSS